MITFKISIDSLADFQAWQGGYDTLQAVQEANAIDELNDYYNTVFNGMTPTEYDINDWLWFERDVIYNKLGIDN